jgi:hypothetical protein
MMDFVGSFYIVAVYNSSKELYQNLLINTDIHITHPYAKEMVCDIPEKQIDDTENRVDEIKKVSFLELGPKVSKDEATLYD